MKKLALVIDFDGTITDDDFFVYVRDAYFDDNALAPWRLYLEGKFTHFNALKQIYGTLRVSEKEINKLVEKVRIDTSALSLFKYCFNKNMPVYIASAGCDYYIKRLIGNEIKAYNITLITNTSYYNKDEGLVIQPPHADSWYYKESTGISKANIVEYLKQNGYFVIFAGDGLPDIEPAKIADIVFAKKILLEKCLELGMSTEEFITCEQIVNYMKNMLE